MGLTPLKPRYGAETVNYGAENEMRFTRRAVTVQRPSPDYLIRKGSRFSSQGFEYAVIF